MLHHRRYLLASACLLCLFSISVGAAGLPEWMKVSFTERLRIETTDNATHLDDLAGAGSSYGRVRTGLMLQVFPAPRWEIAARLTNEFKYYLVPETRDFTLDEAVFDQLYVRWDSVGHMPLSLVVGRQNLNFGEGFVICDGGPLDGSRTAYFNALQAIWYPSAQSSLALIYASQPTQDEWLPVIHDQEKLLVDQDEQAFMAYYTTALGSANLQAYFIRKQNDLEDSQRDITINCPGLRLQAPFVPHLTATAELAAQFGTWDEQDQRGFGGYGYLTYETGWPVHFPKSFTAGTFYLSGDDLQTPEHDGWDPLYGRWPKWSESYVYTLVRENGVAYWTNIASVYGRTVIAVTPEVTFGFDYHHLMAPQYADDVREFPGGDGRVRGDLFIGKLAYQLNPHLTGHLIWEHFLPGNYYFVGADESSWLRMEMFLKF